MELALLQYLPDLSLKYMPKLIKRFQLSQLIADQDLQLYYQIACSGVQICNLRWRKSKVLKCALRLLAFRPLQPNEVLVSTPTTQIQSAPVLATEQAVSNINTVVAAPQEQIQAIAEKKLHHLSKTLLLRQIYKMSLSIYQKFQSRLKKRLI